MNKQAQNYRDTLINAYKDGELSIDDFINTLDYYTDLIKQAPNIRAEREKIAAMALQGLLAASQGHGIYTGIEVEAVKVTDALIHELNKQP